VGCSTGFSTSSGNKNQMDYIHEYFKLENKRWEKLLSEPQALEQHLSQRIDNHKIIFNPRLTTADKNQLVTDHNIKVQELQQLYIRINALELELKKLRFERATRRTNITIDRFFQSFSRKRSLLPKIKTIPYTLIRDKQQQLFQLKRKYHTLHYQYQKNYPSYGAHQTAKQKIHGYQYGNNQRISPV